QARVGRGIGAWRAADRRLIDADHLVEEVDAGDAVVRLGLGVAVVEVLGDGGVEGVVDERRLARAGDAGDAGEEADRDRDVDALQVVAARAGDAQPLLGWWPDPPLRHRDAQRVREVAAGQRFRRRGDVFGPALRHDAAAVDARP